MFAFKTFLLLMFLSSCSALFRSESEFEIWDNLKVKWGVNRSDPENFKVMPRTVQDAVKAGFKLVSECDNEASWRGARYTKENDPAVTLLYDIKGFIVGIQTAIPANLTSGYPKQLIPPFARDGDRYVLTAYFVDPGKTEICNKGRTQEDFDAYGTGTNLYIQNGTVAERDCIVIPKQENNIISPKWTKGKCFPTMGQHYWYNLSDDMDCQDFFPVFLLYNMGRLNGFGWAMMVNLPSPLIEHPRQFVYPLFFESVPKCLPKAGILTTLHIYMTSKVALDKSC